MIGRSRVAVVTLAGILAAQGGAVALDTITRKSTDRRAAGEITAVSNTEVTVNSNVGSPTTVPANDIAAIEWDGVPPALGLARAKEASGQYQLALTDYETARTQAAAGKPLLRADIAYGIASATGKLSLVDPEQLPTALARLNEFVQSNGDHYRYYDALLLLGQVCLAQEDFAAAREAFQRVQTAPWGDYRMAAAVALGRTALGQGDVSGVREAFDRVAAATASNAAEQSRRFEAMLGQATCLQRQQQYAEAAIILGSVIMESAPSDTRLQAEAYVRQGDCYGAQPDRAKEAVMAYLHVDVIPSLAVEKDLHAESLYRLTQLWPRLGRPERADAAAGKLQSLYPNSPWTRQLTGG